MSRRGPNACPTPGCGGRKRRGRPVCSACWSAMPDALRAAVRDAHREGRIPRHLLRHAGSLRVAAALQHRSRDLDPD